jgi:mannosyltransferase
MHSANNPMTETLVLTQDDPSQPPASPSSHFLFTHQEKLYSVLIVLAAVVGVAVRWWAIGKTSLWWDEGYSLWLSQFSLKEIWRGVATDISPPLYYFLLHGWIRFFGVSEFSLRSMSAFFETLSIPIFFLIARRVLQDKLGVTVAMWLYALSSFQAHYARDARFYGVLCFFALAGVYSLIEFLETRSYLAFVFVVISVSAGLYTHNMMFFYLPGLAVLWIVYPVGPRLGRRILDGLLCVIAVFLLFSPWLANLIAQTKLVSKSFWIPRPTFGDLADTLCALSGLDPRYVARFTAHSMHLSFLDRGRLFRLGFVVLLLICTFGALAQAISANRRKVAALLGFALGPILLVFFYSRSGAQPIFLDRAFIASSATIPLVLAGCVAYQSGRRRKTLFTSLAVVLIVAVGISLTGFFSQFQNEDWRGATTRLLSLPAERRLVVFVANAGQVLFDYYAAQSSNLSARPEETGLPEKFNYQDLAHAGLGFNLSSFDRASALQPLQQALESQKFIEIDVVTAHIPLSLRELVWNSLSPNYMKLPDEDFVHIRVTRWMLRAQEP